MACAKNAQPKKYPPTHMVAIARLSPQQHKTIRYHIFPMTDNNTTSTEVDSPNHSGNPYNGCLSLDIHLTDF